MIKKTLDANQISNCEVLNIGLSSKKEKSRIYINTSGNIGSSTLSKEHSSRDNNNSFAESELIDLDAGDENILLQSLNSIDLIKIDVEGHESDVVIGLRKLIKKHSPIMILEWNNSETKSRFAKDEHLKEFIEKLFIGYRESFGDAKKTLDKYSLGLAHHKVIHIISIHEGITISNLLKKLKT